jgi:transposase
LRCHLLGSTEATKWHAWGIASENAIAYRVLPSRSVEAAEKVLGSYRGIAVVDGYGAYRSLQSSRAGPTFVLAHCWSHVQRKYVEAEPHHPKATEMIEKIGALYEIERRASEAPAEERVAVRAELRRTESKPIVDDIYRWVTSEQALPRSLLGKALGYTRQLWPGLVRFVDDARIPLDTNQLERGTQVAALFYGLFETAKLVGVDPAAYLAEATRRAIANPGTVTLPSDLVSS